MLLVIKGSMKTSHSLLLSLFKEQINRLVSVLHRVNHSYLLPSHSLFSLLFSLLLLLVLLSYVYTYTRSLPVTGSTLVLLFICLDLLLSSKSSQFFWDFLQIAHSRKIKKITPHTPPIKDIVSLAPRVVNLS